jgi:hypothetical protein
MPRGVLLASSRVMSADWKHWLRGGFGFERSDFACHPLDRERALRMFYLCLAGGVSLKEIGTETEVYLRSIGCKNEHGIAGQVEDVLKFCKSTAAEVVRTKKKALLITWECSTADHPLSEQLISIMDSRISEQRVFDFVEQYYASSMYSIQAKMEFATRPKHNPYRAQRANAHIHCGESPLICARVVKNLALIRTRDSDTITWEELPTREIALV